MKRLLTLVLAFALLLTMQSSALAGVDWDGDPLLDVDGVKVHISFNVGGGDFVRSGGSFDVLAQAPEIRLLGKGPRYVATQAVSAVGDPGKLILTVTLSGEGAPGDLLIRVRVPKMDSEQIVSALNGQPVTIDLP